MKIEYNIGDIVTFKKDKKTKIERIEAIELSKGDIVYITTLGSHVRSVDITEIE